MLGKSGNPNVALEHFEDFEKAIAFVAAHSPLREHLIFRERISDLLEALPAHVAAALLRTFRYSPSPAAVGNLAARVGWTESWLRRVMKGAGFRDVHHTFWARQVLSARAFACDDGYETPDVAHKVGFNGSKGLIKSLAQIGCYSREQFSALAPSTVLDSILAIVRR